MTFLNRSVIVGRLVGSTCLKQNGFLGVTYPGVQQTATLKDLSLPPNYDHVEYPPERRKLRFLERQPQPIPGQRMPKMMKRIFEMRGPELIHNKLIHKQYGIRALTGGRLKYGHIEMIRMNINRRMDDKKMFAVWRIDSPWKAITKKGQGHRMGGGKGSIDHYVTPVKAGRIIIEMGGHVEFAEVVPLLKLVVNQLPFKAEVVNQEMMEEEVDKERHLVENNLNPFSFEYCVKNNMRGCRSWLSTYDYQWFNKYR